MLDSSPRPLFARVTIYGLNQVSSLFILLTSLNASTGCLDSETNKDLCVFLHSGTWNASYCKCGRVGRRNGSV